MKHFFYLLVFIFSMHLPTATYSQSGISLDGLNDYVNCGNNNGLALNQFTLEIWFKREGTGVSVRTDTDGVSAFPLISKGRTSGITGSPAMNYFLGIDSLTNTLCADFEEGIGQLNPGKNRPIRGVTPICYFRWYHAAVTYDGISFKLYLNGTEEVSTAFNVLPYSGSLPYTSIGSTLNSSGTPSGYFNGRLDEARIWNYARTQSQINLSITQEISSAAGLSGRWSMNESSGNTCFNTASASGSDGQLINGVTRVKGSSFDTLSSQGNFGIRFEGDNSYISFGNNGQLGLSQFTLETWFMRRGTGTAATTGSGGVIAIPIIAKGRGESDGNNRDMNYFLGIDTSTGFLVADFEEAIGQRNPGRNHPVIGATQIQYNVWYHAAATYDGATWNLYLNGNLENQLFVGQLPQSQSIQHASIGTALNSAGTPEGFFDGVIDEVRLWNIPRSQSEIRSTMNIPLTTAQSWMIARWDLDDSCNTLISESSGNIPNVLVQNKNWFWTDGASFDIPVQSTAPHSSFPSNQTGNVYLNSNLSVSVSDPEGKDLSVTYFVQPCPNPAPADFTVVGMPDTQHYVSYMFGGTNEMLKSQTSWIAQNRVSENIVFVQGLGDCVQNGDNGGDSVEWERLDTAMKIIEDPITTVLQHGVPFALCVGNHDQSPIGDVMGTTNFFNSYFGESRFQGRNYYGGHYGTKNNNNYSFFSAGGLDFIVINLEYNLNNIDTAVARWLRELLTLHSNRLAIIGSHYMLNGDGTFAPQGLAIYNVIKRFPNVVLTQSGHVSAESNREDVYDGNKIISIMADYQSRSYGGSGWMRLLKFSPANHTLSIKTWSPWLNQFETDSNSQFSYSFDMSPKSGYTLLGTNSAVPSGSNDSMALSNLLPNTCYYWYVEVSNGSTTVKSPVWQFQTVAECTEILGFSPATGAEGDTVEITGKKLSLVSALTFNGTPAAFNIINDTVIVTIVPAGAGNGRIIIKGSCTDSSSTDFIVHNCTSFPNAFAINGSGAYCSIPGLGSLIELDGSEIGVDYQLFRNNIPVSSSIPGTGTSLSFGNQIQIGNYTILATNASVCTSMMSGYVEVSILQNPMISIHAIDSILCYGESANISVQASGGLAPYNSTGIYQMPAGTHQFSISDANGCIASNQIHITQPSKLEATIFQTNTTCNISNGNVTVIITGGTPGYNYLWSGGQTTQSISGLAPAIYSVMATDQNGCTIGSSTTLSSNGPTPGTPGSIGGASGVCRGSVITYSIATVQNASGYQWTLPAGTSGSSTSNSITVTFLSTFNGGFICVSAQNACGTGASTCLNVNVLTLKPTNPSVISGAVNACPLNTYTYSVSPVQNATNYVWIVTGTGAIITQGQGTNTISINIGSGFSKGKVSVYASNCKGNSSSRFLDIVGVPIHSSALNGPSYICAGSSGHTYSIAPVVGATSYLWFVVSGNLQIASQSGNSSVVNAGSSFTTGVIAVATFNSCGSYSKSYTLRSVPAQPGGISGSNNGVCLKNGLQYSIAAVAGATSYTWSVPSGVNIVSPAGTSVTLDYTSNFIGIGNICVVARNSCGPSISRCMQVTATLAPPSTINGSSSACKSESNVTYTIPPVTGANSYSWNISGGANITPLGNGSSAFANFNWASSAQLFISVNCENACGYGTSVTKNISVNLTCRNKEATEKEIQSLSIFPNPSVGKTTITFYSKELCNYRFSIIDAIGKQWYFETGTYPAGLNFREFDLAILPRGMYFFIAESESNGKEKIRLVLN
ncbi:MAG: T9SS type A sorting domain-containing protein [Bacteroidia bacterium]|nr:T9SS type A sorting domain-containing protein [Bacteroidia bacterium]